VDEDYQQQAQRAQIQQQTEEAIQQQQQNGQQPPHQPVLTMRDAIIFAITYCRDLRTTIKMPYFLTLTPAELEALAAGNDGDPAGTAGGAFRGRTRNITSGWDFAELFLLLIEPRRSLIVAETFVCLNKVWPTPTEQRDNCSAYSAGWSPPDCVNGEAQIIQLFLSACSASGARPRLDQLSGQYTLAASKESVQLRTTHSSFWSQQQQKVGKGNGIFCNLYIYGHWEWNMGKSIRKRSDI
jgi:hypothetical protein